MGRYGRSLLVLIVALLIAGCAGAPQPAADTTPIPADDQAAETEGTEAGDAADATEPMTDTEETGDAADATEPMTDTEETGDAADATDEEAAADGETETLRLATTTSTYDSGLLDAILPDFEEEYSAEVEVVAVGTGQALTLGENGDADVILVHARAREDAFVEEGYGVNRRDVMYNDFVVVGPSDDPAGIEGMEMAAEAFAAIAETESTFASRGDDSGTHTKEQLIWEEAGVEPDSDMAWYRSMGQGMGATLVAANEQLAYTLADRGTFLSMQEELPDLEVLVGGDSIEDNADPMLLNPYGVIPVNPEQHEGINAELAEAFAEWLTSDETQAMIAEFGTDTYGQPLFFPGAAPTGVMEDADDDSAEETPEATPEATPEETSDGATPDDAAADDEPALLRLATTTSTADTGLLDAILPDFEEEYNAEVEYVAVGTGQALKLGENGDADVVLVHARTREDQFVEEGYGVNRRDVMYNDFVIVGPPADPAGVQGMETAAEAYEAIADAEETFVSRGDDSGTHIKELSIWRTVGFTPTAEMEWYQAVGQGMGATLTFADEQQAYVMTDRATFLSMRDGIDLEIMVGGESIAENQDPALLNSYGIIPVNPETHPDVNYELAEAFSEWFTSVEVLSFIKDFGIDRFGQPLYYPNSEQWKAQEGDTEAAPEEDGMDEDEMDEMDETDEMTGTEDAEADMDEEEAELTPTP
jgi:tungstate transport system substrate-binding protein